MKLKYDTLLSSCAFKCKLRPCAMAITINEAPIKGSPFTLTVLKLFPPVQDVARFSNTVGSTAAS